MNVDNLPAIISILKKETEKYILPSVSQIALLEKDRPFRVLISCILSLRTKDEVTFPASERLFKRAPTLQTLSELDPKEIEKIIFPAGFYKTKAKQIPEICRKILEEYDGKVPDEIDELLKLKGVGRKTANLVVTLGYGKEGICVDTHVHRISNRLGFVQTKDANQTEFKLREILPRKYWIDYNDLLVTWGQNVCKPISPFCSNCGIEKYCEKIGVLKSR